MPKRTEKDMTVVRKTVPFEAAIKKKLTHAELKNYLGNGNVVMLRWGMNDAAIRDKIVSIRLGGQEAYIDLEELLSYTRLI